MATAVIQTAWHAWRSAMQACFGMPVVFAVALLLSLVYSAVVLVLKPEAAGGLEVASLLYMVATNAVEAFLMTPLVVALLRFFLLQEVAGRYEFRLSDPRFVRFLLALVALGLIYDAGGIVWFLARRVPMPDWRGAILQWIALAVLVASYVVTLRFSILFPAIVSDAPGANWRNALYDSSGSLLRIFCLFVLTVGPTIVLQWLVLPWAAGFEGEAATRAILYAAVYSVSGLAALAAYAAVTVQLYTALGKRLRTPR